LIAFEKEPKHVEKIWELRREEENKWVPAILISW